MEIDELTDVLNTSETIDRLARRLYKKLQQSGETNGRRNDLLQAACVVTAAKCCEEPLRLKSVAAETPHSPTELFQAVRVIQRTLDVGVPVLPPGEYIAQFKTELSVDSHTTRLAQQILDAVPQNLIVGRSPLALAAAAIYLASCRTNDEVTQSQLQDVFDVCPNTIRTRYEEFKDSINAPLLQSRQTV